MSEGRQDDGDRWQEGRRWWRRREGDRQGRYSRGADVCTSLKMGHRRMVPGAFVMHATLRVIEGSSGCRNVTQHAAPLSRWWLNLLPSSPPLSVQSPLHPHPISYPTLRPSPSHPRPSPPSTLNPLHHLILLSTSAPVRSLAPRAASPLSVKCWASCDETRTTMRSE